MNLYLLRHGIAVEPGASIKDAERPLTPRGRRRLVQITRAMRALRISFDLILTSPYVRAEQTAGIVARSLKLKQKLACFEALTPGGNPQALVQHLNGLRPKSKSVLLVGHEPYLSKLVALLTSGNTNLEMDFKKGGFCKLEIEKLRCGRCATLAWLLAPRQMALMSKRAA